MSVGAPCRPCGRPAVAGHHLPIDTPPRPSSLPNSVLRGLSWEADFGGTVTPVPRPWTQWSAPSTFPLSVPSAVGPAFIAPRYGFSINDWSPVSHWRARQRREDKSAVPAIPSLYAGKPKIVHRVRYKVTVWPPVNPSWPAIGGGRVE